VTKPTGQLDITLGDKSRPRITHREEREMSRAESANRGAAKIDDHRDDLADLAESDLPCSEIAEQLLEIADEEI